MRLAFVLALAACSHPAPPAVNESPPPANPSVGSAATPVDDKPLDLTLRVRAERNHQKFGIAADDTLKSGDYVEMFVDLRSPAYLYVVQFFADGTSAVLYPSQGDKLVQPGTEIRIPDGGNSFQLDDHTGEENVYVLASRTPVAQADATVATQITEIRKSGDEPAAAPPPPKPAGPDAGVARTNNRVGNGAPPLKHRPDHMLSLATRNLKLVKRPDGDPALTGSAEKREDNLLVVRFSFKHQ